MGTAIVPNILCSNSAISCIVKEEGGEEMRGSERIEERKRVERREERKRRDERKVERGREKERIDTIT